MLFGGSFGEADDLRAPEEGDAKFLGSVMQNFMKADALNSSAYACGETGLDGPMALNEANAGEYACVCVLQGDTEVCERGYCVWHQAFAAGFVDRGLEAVGYCYVEALLANCDGSGETCWASAANQHVGFEHTQGLLRLVARLDQNPMVFEGPRGIT
jgi:hypothetical protein